MVAAFVIYVTQRGELPAYIALVVGPGPQGNVSITLPKTGQTSDNSTSSTGTKAVSEIGSIAEIAALFA